ncbi:ribonuclease HI [Candidatus Haliotispira prima]|uniref:Ribonuclease H n=1 Tax=Candidatus Haliotispira prima TaxID=3034016 RepID=A0ABY8MKU3_9SPIO|nr:ribonuclease HI [Candidatus Haliotispira prima]
MERVVVYTDGGCRGNPGPGAWAAVSYSECEYPQKSEPGKHRNRGDGDNGIPTFEISGAAAQTTNNRMELQAVIEGLKALPSQYPQLFEHEQLAGGKHGRELPEIAVYTDSQYVKNGITTWIHNWKKNDWRTSTKKPVKNKELWQELDHQVSTVQQYASLCWHWVKGHAGHYYNERCDTLVQQKFPR